MPAHIEHVHGQVIFVDPEIVEAVPPQRSGGDELPVYLHGPGNGGGQDHWTYAAALASPLAQRRWLVQGVEGLVALQEREVAAGVVADAGDEFDGVGEFDDVVVGAAGEGLCLGGSLFLGAQHDEGRQGRLGWCGTP